MVLFVAGVSRDGPADAERAAIRLGALLERLPFFPGRKPSTWSDGRAALAWATHPPADLGRVAYVVTEPHRFALFAGRPFAWTADAAADGRAPLDARFYIDAIPDTLDGRWAALRYDGDELEVRADATGAYPLYTTESGGTRWYSNNPELARSIADARSMSDAVLASLLGGGWSLTGDPAWAGVRRVGEPPPAPLPPADDYNPDRAAARLTAAARALADWPGRPNVVPVTGGRDSRLVLAAALAAGVDFATTTGAVEGSRDVAIGRTLADRAGVAHELIADDPHGSLEGDWRRAAELIALTAAGTSSLSDAAGYPFGPRPGPLPLWHSGQGGEVARAYYGLGAGLSRDALTDRLYAAFVGRRPGRRELLAASAAALVRDEIARFVDRQLGRGVDPIDVPDAFYAERRMGTWAGPTHGCVEYVRDTTSPLWSRRVVEEMLTLDARARAEERFHTEMLRRLAPQLMTVPYEDGTLPGAPPTGRTRGARSLARKVVAEARRRLAVRAPEDPLVGEVRGLVLDQPDHPAWSVLDRPRVEQLLSATRGQLDTMSRYYVWRLATVFSMR